jgi:phage tail-like protein
MAAYYPPVGFHFKVEFIGVADNNDSDTRFQEVSGLEMALGTEEVIEGGENRFTHKLPDRAKYGNLTLKRGMLTNSELIGWIKDAIENFNFQPVELMVKLLNEKHEPLVSWVFTKVWPVKWSISDFKSTENSIVVETLELAYNYFRRV